MKAKKENSLDVSNLLRTCRHIHAEFLHFLVMNRTVRVHLCQIPQFMASALCHLFFSNSVPENALCTVEIALNGLEGIETVYETYLHPLFRLIVNRPNVTLKFTAAWQHGIYGINTPRVGGAQLDHLNRIFSPSKRVAWAQALKTTIVNLRLSVAFSTEGMCIHMLIISKEGMQDSCFIELGLIARRWCRPIGSIRNRVFVDEFSAEEVRKGRIWHRPFGGYRWNPCGYGGNVRLV